MSEITLETKSLREVFEYNLTIPDYQRNYCWEDEEVNNLWRDLEENAPKGDYHLGIVIFQQNDSGEFEIIDGQQRLVTLTLIADKLNHYINVFEEFLGKYSSNGLWCDDLKKYKELLEDRKKFPQELSLLKAKLYSKSSNEHVGNTKNLIENRIESDITLSKEKLKKLKNTEEVAGPFSDVLENFEKLIEQYKEILNHTQLSILILGPGTSLSLAYTFFSNENSKGLTLTDYDLLKAHHLRFVLNEDKSMDIAKDWDNLITNRLEDDEYWPLKEILSTHLLRLRYWIRKNNFIFKERFVKREFSAAVPMDGIKIDQNLQIKNPNYYDTIIGGIDFFEYCKFFEEKYCNFIKESVCKELKNHLISEHRRYRSVIETLLFAYYLKFGSDYLYEALFCISTRIEKHRYDNSRATFKSIFECVHQSDIVMVLNETAHPTFFLQECFIKTNYDEIDEQLDKVKEELSRNGKKQNIQTRFRDSLCNLFNKLGIDKFHGNELQKRVRKYTNKMKS